MFPRVLTWLTTLLLASAGGGAAAHDGPLDAGFGDGGMRAYGFQSVNGSGRDDRAAVACPRADGGLVVVGAASDARRIVTVRLLPNGDYDPAFSSDGRETFELAMTPATPMAGLCLPDGKILLARRLDAATAGQSDVQLVRLDGNTGLPDASFGQNGVHLLDMDSWQSGLDGVESPYALAALDGGEVLVMGRVRRASRNVAFAARVTADARVPAARVFVDAPNRATANVLLTAVPAGDGRLWGIVEGIQPGSTRVTPFRVRFDRQTLQWLDVPDPLPGAGEDIYSGRGVRVRDDVIAVPLMQAVAGTTPPRFLPALMVYRAGGKVFLPLPPPSLPGETLAMSTAYASQSVTVLPGGRVLVAAAVGRPGELVDRGIHLAIVRIGAAAGDDTLETSFGVGGAQTAAFRPAGAACAGALVEQSFAAGTFWRGQPVLAGYADADCSNPGGGRDYLVARLRTDRVFADGFD